MNKFAIAVHGGCGSQDKNMSAAEKQDLHSLMAKVVNAGKVILEWGGTAVDAVEAAVMVMEDDPIFNAGRGGTYNSIGEIELDASIMDGKNFGCGAVAGVRTVANPIKLARAVMDQSKNVLLICGGAERFAEEIGFKKMPPEYFQTESRYKRYLAALAAEEAANNFSERKKGTVGAVALDCAGNLAAATSTGGILMKKYGRVGDTPIIGAGTYADNRTCAVSCTGTGEEFIRYNVARDVSTKMEYLDYDIFNATDAVINPERGHLQPDDGGLVAVDRFGNVAWQCTCDTLLRGTADSDGRFETGIWTEGEPQFYGKQ